MKVAILNFPGTNCERDTKYAFDKLGFKTEIIWHKENDFKADLVVLPGGFSYGDYLRTAAIAKFSPIMKAVVEHAKKGGLILGICNGFQMLLELHLLDGAMNKNEKINFLSLNHYLKIESNDNLFCKNFNLNEVIRLPIAHGEGNYYIDEVGYQKLKDNNQILLSYCDENGNALNPNGSVGNIAGICDKNKKIFGLMPHPERAVEKLIGTDDGLKLLKGFAC